MNYSLIKDILDLLEKFESEVNILDDSNNTIEEFKRWVAMSYNSEYVHNEPNWEGKEKGRSPESVINTLIVHMNRYAKNYSKAAIWDSDFSSQEDFIYLITLKAFGEMSKMDLIKKNVHEKPAGMQIINRLIDKEWVNQIDSQKDKRSKILKINKKGLESLELQMDKIRKATEIVTGDLTYNEKMELIKLLNKLNDFHIKIYDKNIDPEHLLEEAYNDKKIEN
ncbi:MAG TPA: helix-turn-helix domain-containing protein [Edaphocola sp.]|nr:helix-turn-helix domain-containing protein [Edaphocola sp.]